MNKGIVCLVTILLSAVAAYGAYFGWVTLQIPNEPLEWLQSEYDLSNETVAQVAQAKEAYLPGCREMCRRLAEARKELTERSSSTTATSLQITEAYAAVNAI